MNKEIKEEWLKALRSEEYKQGKGALCTLRNGEKTYCCLGVLSDILVKKGHGEWFTKEFEGSTYFGFVQNNSPAINTAYLSSLHANLCGLEENPRVDCGDGIYTLAQLNDGIACSQLGFKEIADLIEAQL